MGRYVGKLTKFNGKLLYPGDAYKAAKVDEVLDAFDDLWIIFAPTYKIKDKDQKEKERQRLFSEGGEAHSMLVIFENILAASTDGYVVPGAGLTVADLVYFCFLNLIRSGFVEGLGLQMFDKFEKIVKHREMVANIPIIKTYYEKKETSYPSGVPYYDVF